MLVQLRCCGVSHENSNGRARIPHVLAAGESLARASAAQGDVGLVYANSTLIEVEYSRSQLDNLIWGAAIDRLLDRRRVITPARRERFIDHRAVGNATP